MSALRTAAQTESPAPWKVILEDDGLGELVPWGIVDAAGHRVVETDAGVYPPARVVADFIVRAVNAHDALVEALRGLLDRYTALVNCGDCGDWDPETEPEVIAARAALAKAEGPANG